MPGTDAQLLPKHPSVCIFEVEGYFFFREEETVKIQGKQISPQPTAFHSQI